MFLNEGFLLLVDTLDPATEVADYVLMIEHGQGHNFAVDLVLLDVLVEGKMESNFFDCVEVRI